MKILIVCSGKPSNPKWNFKLNRSYVYEQAESIKDLGMEYDTYFIEGKGVFGYLKNYKNIIKKIKEYQPDLVHAHYGLSGLLSNLQRKVPVVTTFHGSDINIKKNRLFSYVASKLSADNIFVNDYQPAKINYHGQRHVIPCGVDSKRFFLIDKYKARKKLNLDLNKKYGLFTGSFDNGVKNYPLAKEAILKSKSTIELLELKAYTREEVSLLLNAVDFLLMTSFSEGSPMVIKEAMCCNCPIVTVDVGDVKKIISRRKNCYVTTYHPEKISECINQILTLDKRIEGKETLNNYSLEKIANRVVKVYQRVLSQKN